MRYLAADVGGTFTDLVLLDAASGRLLVDKVPSAERGSAASIAQGMAQVLGTAGLGPQDLDLFVHGFTVATNAFLMRRGARVALLVTEGFRDLLEIGTQQRPHLYALRQSKPPPVVQRDQVVAVRERVDSFGAVVQPLEPAAIAEAVAAVRALEPDAIALCLNFSFLNPAHEEQLATALRQALPEAPLYLSSCVNPEIEEFPRANTTSIAAYVGPIVDRYLKQLERDLEAAGLTAPLRLMRSDGGMATPRAARANPASMLLSGPAGGVIAGQHLGRRLGVSDLVTFDMGGTSADFSAIVEGQPKRVTGRDIDGQPLRLPSLDIETISAGGGSLAWIDRGGALRVGPDSAGAVPGPACYGKGGDQATLTDACVVLGLLAPEDYLGGAVAIEPDLAKRAIADQVARPLGLSVEEAALGSIFVANALMGQAIRTLSVERGLDVRRFALLAFGGAGPLYAPYLLRDLSMESVLVPRHPGVFAAEGLLLTDISHSLQQPYRRSLGQIAESEVSNILRDMIDTLAKELEADGVAPEKRSYHCSADCRYLGQFHEIEVALASPDSAGWWDWQQLAQSVVERHRALYGHAEAGEPLETMNLRVEGRGAIETPRPPSGGSITAYDAKPTGRRQLYLERGGGWRDCPIYRREDLAPGAMIPGPALITQVDSTVLLLAGHAARVEQDAAIKITASSGESA
ncbi:MAG: hydantoinase/oxoprolinase family protein [Pseudomonadota bacterium]